jgi:hypothetical protein
MGGFSFLTVHDCIRLVKGRGVGLTIRSVMYGMAE